MERWTTLGFLAVLLLCGTATAQPSTAKAQLNSLTSAARELTSSSERVIRLQEEEIKKATQDLEQVRQLVNEGLLARNELATKERALEELKIKLANTHQEIADAERSLKENENPAKLGTTQNAKSLVRPTMLRYNGSATWSVAKLTDVQEFFSTRFRRALPTSAVGQSATHNRLGWDHRHAVDVAVHPDSAEGKALISYLRTNGIPFQAFRGPVPGVSTGPHIHIGTPSHRLS